MAREPFIRAIAAVTAFADASDMKRPAVRFAFSSGHLPLSAAMDGCGSACRGSACAVVDVAATTMREPRDIGFCGPQILDILNSLQGQYVRFDFCDVSGPNNFAGDRADGNALLVIMPVRV